MFSCSVLILLVWVLSFAELDHGSVNLTCFLKNKLSDLLILYIVFVVSISLISALPNLGVGNSTAGLNRLILGAGKVCSSSGSSP